MSTINNYTISKSLNGINYINADEITTDVFNVNNISATQLNVSGASTFSQPPNMSGANISTSSIPYQSISGYQNIVLKNSGNEYNAGTTSLTNYMYADNNVSNGAFFVNNQGAIGYWDNTTNIWTIDSTGLQTIRNITFSPNSPDNNKLTAFPARKLLMGDNAILLRGGVDFNHYIKYVNYVTGGSGERIDGVWIQGYAGGALCSSSATYTNQIHLKWQYGAITSVAPHTFTGGINANATQTIDFGTNAPTMKGTNITNIPDSAISSNVVLKNTSNTITGTIIPLWGTSGYTGCYKLGDNIGTYHNTLSTNNIAYGNYSLNGAYNSNPLYTRASENVCLGHYTGYKFSDLVGDNSTSCNRNVVIGNQALKNAYLNTNDNVVIGYQAGLNTPVLTNCVIIGSGALKLNGAGQTNSTIIGYNNMTSAGANAGDNTVIGSNNFPVFNGNSGICIGSNNADVMDDNNGGLIIGSFSASDHTIGTGCYYIGKFTGNHNATGYNNIYMGNFINGNSGAYYNTYAIGHFDNGIGQAAIQDDNEFVITGCQTGTGWARLTLPNKNYVYCCQYPQNFSTFTLNFRTGDVVVLPSGVNIIYLPTPDTYDYNNGARFTFIRNYSNSFNVSLIINAPSGNKILDSNGNPQTTITLAPNITVFTLYCINSFTNTNTWVIENNLTRCQDLIGSFTNITYSGRIINTNINNNTIIGNNNSTNSYSNCILIGNNAGKFLTNANATITAIGHDALYSLSGSSFQNCAIGTQTLYNLQSGNYNLAVGSYNGNALNVDCFLNYSLGHNVLTSSYYPPSTYILYSGATISVLSTTITLSAIPANLKAGCKINTYDVTGTKFEATVQSFNPTTFVLTLASGIKCQTGTYVLFYDIGKLTATYTMPTTTTGTTFTITPGLTINTGAQIGYRASATLAQSNTVISYNSTTGLLTTGSSITVFGGTIMYFNNSNEFFGTAVNKNSVAGTQSLNRVCSYATNNTSFGYNSLSCNDGALYKSFLGGNNNTCFGSNSGASISFLSSNNTFIGAYADASTNDVYNIQQSTAIGYGAKVNGSNQIVLGTTSEVVVFPSKQIVFGGAGLTQWYPNSIGATYTANASMSSPFSGHYFINSATTLTFTLPAITTDMVGLTFTFRRVNATISAVMNVLATGTNTVMGYNSGTNSLPPTTAVLMPANICAATVRCVNIGLWCIYP